MLEMLGLHAHSALTVCRSSRSLAKTGFAWGVHQWLLERTSLIIIRVVISSTFTAVPSAEVVHQALVLFFEYAALPHKIATH